MHPNTSETTRLRPLSPNAMWRRARWLLLAFALGLLLAGMALHSSVVADHRTVIVYGDGNTVVLTDVTACGVSLICGD